MNVDSIKTILRKYLNNKADANERQRVDHWYQQLDKEQDPDLSVESEQRIKSEIWGAIRANMPATMQQKSNRRLYLRYAAASAIIICLSTLYWFRQSSAPANSGAIKLTEIATASGEKKQVTLIDGSTLTLHEKTIVRIHPDFLHNRYVELSDGEVFFEVTKDKKHPFRVKSEHLTTEVLGTSFHIDARQSQAETEVAVSSGSVRVAVTSQQPQVLAKGDLLRYDKKTRSISRLKMESPQPALRQADVVIDDLSFAEMTKIMHTNYRVVLKTTSNSIKNMHFTATLRKDMTADEAIEVILNIHQLKSKKRRNYVEVYP